MSDGRPVAFLDASYDHASGLYGAVSASGVVTDDEAARPLGVQVNGGYVKRLSSDVTLDLGVVHSRYSRHSGAGTARSYTEVYGGLAHKFITSRIYVSPHYFSPDVWTLYGELDGNVSPAPKLRLHGHVGMLIPIHDGREDGRLRSGYDWRIGVSRELGPASVQATFSGGNGGRSRGTLSVGVAWSL